MHRAQRSGAKTTFSSPCFIEVVIPSAKMVRSALQVFTRTRPTSEFAHDSIRVDDENSTLHIHLDRKQDSQGPGLHNLTENWSFRTSKVLHNSSQDAVYAACARDMVAAALDGYNGTLMVGRIFGSGKIYTVVTTANDRFSVGLRSDRRRQDVYDDWGYSQLQVSRRGSSCVGTALPIHCRSPGEPRHRPYLLPRSTQLDATALNAVILMCDATMLQIYNESFIDLLADDGSNSRELAVMENGRGNVEVKGLRKVETRNEEEGLNLLFEGNANRKVGKHLSNVNSSRSHTIFIIHIESRSRVKAQEKVSLGVQQVLVLLIRSLRAGRLLQTQPR